MKKLSLKNSLAKQLMLYSVLFTYFLLVGFWAVLYFSLKTHLVAQDQEILRDRIKIISSLLGPSGSREALVHRVQKEWFERNYERIVVQVLDSNGSLITETPGLNNEHREILSRLLNQSVTRDGILERVQTPNGGVYQVSSIRIEPEIGKEFLVGIAIERTNEQHLLAAFRRYFRYVLIIAGAWSLLMGRVIMRIAIGPVRKISKIAASVNSETLNEQIDPLSLPKEFRELAFTMNKMLDRLRDSFDRLARFSEDMAHELRTPVNNLLGSMSVMLTRDREPIEYKNLLGSGIEECERLKRIIDSLLFIARAADPSLMLRKHPLPLKEELQNIVSFYEASAEEGGVRLALQTEDSVPLFSERTLFQRCIGNLISNSIRYSKPGTEIRVKTRTEKQWITVQVIDAGSGIPESALAHIGERFFRVDPSRTKVQGGTGLGLSIVKSIMFVHGGKMDVTSQLGAGTTVTLQFPNLS